MCQHKHSVLLKVIIILVVSTCVLAQYSGGSGTAEDPYQIATAVDLIQLGETSNRSGWLTDDFYDAVD